MLGDFLKALSQMGDRRFWGVIAKGVGLAALLLAAIYAAFVTVLPYLVPDTITLPWIGTFSGVDALLGWASLGLMILLSIVLMVPVAAAFAGVFADDVADAVEARHYAYLSPAPQPSLGDSLVSSVNFLGLVIAVNAVALVVYLFSGPLAPLVFWAVNGYLLGREYFLSIATRRLGKDVARALRKRYSGRIWLAGALMAAPLSIPFVNLLIPVLGAATFTHMFHRLARLSA
ncbi:MAG: EI24 domain-containing protein [Pseudomonadota bacterium]